MIRNEIDPITCDYFLLGNIKTFCNNNLHMFFVLWQSNIGQLIITGLALGEPKGEKRTTSLFYEITSLFSEMIFISVTTAEAKIICVKNVRASVSPVLISHDWSKSRKKRETKCGSSLGFAWLCYLAGKSQTAPTFFVTYYFGFSWCGV